MRLNVRVDGLFVFIVVLVAIVLAWGAGAQTTSQVGVGYGAGVPASCSAVSPALFVQRGTTGLLSINACTNGKYSQIWQAERFADGETPALSANGASLAHLPNPATSLLFTRNGLVQRAGVDYQLQGQSIIVNSPIASGDLLQAWYRY